MGNAALLPVAFEVILIAGALLVLMVAVIADRRRSVWAPIAGVAYLAAAAAGILQWRAVAESGGDLYFSTPDIVIVRSPMVVMDGFSAFAAILLGLLGFVALLGSWDLVVRLGKRSAEFVALGLLAVAGLHMMAATPNLIVIFIGLETASISFYILAGFIRESRASDESALKYFLLGSLASAMFTVSPDFVSPSASARISALSWAAGTVTVISRLGIARRNGSFSPWTRIKNAPGDVKAISTAFSSKT